jgi:prolyl-tRNA editing enzyme YbaK/EbsC (Cys-tRNA(Pro) deacylase)
MSIDKVREFFKRYGLDGKIIEFPTSSATVPLAAEALGVTPARIAKTLSFKKDDSCILIVMAGDAKIDNAKFKSEFSMKARMLTPEEVITLVGHEIGGVCPFGINENIPVYLDISMKRFDTIFPACGSSNSAIEFTCEELFNYSNGVKWIDICKGWNE